MKLIRYIKSIIHYYKTRRSLLKRGGCINESFKTSNLTRIDEELKLIDEVVLRNGKKYNIKLDYVVNVDWIDEDFATDLKTVNIEMWCKIQL